MSKPLTLAKLEEIQRLAAAKVAPKEIAFRVGCSRQTVYTWLKKIKESGGDCEEALRLTQSKTGRPRKLEFNAAETNLARWYRLTKESVDVAAWFFIRSDKTYDGTDELIVRPAIAEMMRGYEEKAMSERKRIAWPRSVLRAFHVTDEERSLFEGKKSHQQTEMVTRRGMFEMLEDGTQREILPGMVWELDDYSTNQPYWHECPESKTVNVNRQVLAAKDLAASLWLGFDHIGRERDAYRAEDVLRFIERLVRSHGLPGLLRLERGIWESSGVHGLKLDDGDRWGDLRDIMRVEHVFKSKSKSIIEGGFNFLQRWLGHTGIDIGRKRGQFELAAKRLRQSRNVNLDARELGFLSIHESSDKHEAAARVINDRQAMREHLNERVAPNDLVARHGWHTKSLPEDSAWYFYPTKKAAVVSSGQVRINPGAGWAPLYFTVNGIIDGLHLETGHKVLVACDPARPELGARIVNNETGPRNREHFGLHEVLFTAAPCHGLAPQFSAAEALSPHLIARRKATAGARTSFRAIVANGQGPREVAAADGQGNSAKAGTIKRNETQAQTPAPAETMPAPAPSPRPVAPEAATSSRFSRFASPEARAAEIARLETEISEA
jgi:predicted DNA-binding protein YlxM (UPF0122 family)